MQLTFRASASFVDKAEITLKKANKTNEQIMSDKQKQKQKHQQRRKSQ